MFALFRRLASQVPNVNVAEALISLHSFELLALLEMAWNVRRHAPTTPPGHPDHRSDTPGIAIPLPAVVLTPPSVAGTTPTPASSLAVLLASMVRGGGVVWDHLIYAYMIENTRIYEIFRRVLHECLHGERLGAPTAAAQHWLRNTEELFYRDPQPFAITAVSSHIRSDMRASRRNAYQRMFGMDLNHGTDDNAPYPYIRAETANNEFVSTFEELLREVWVGIVHLPTTSGPNPTDNAKIATLAEKLQNMLISRRQGGNLSREEFAFVAMMSWFHLTVEFESPIIVALRAQAASPEERLFKIASQVGLPAHGLSNSYFRVADPISRVLLLIETGLLNTASAAPAFYNPNVNPPNPLPDDMNTIITHWSIITGRDMKARKVATT